MLHQDWGNHQVKDDQYQKHNAVVIDVYKRQFQDWTPEDTKNLDMIVHEVYLIMMGKNATEDVFLCWKMLLFIRDSFIPVFIDLEAVLKVKLTEVETDWE